MKREILEKARLLAGEATPLVGDCGRACGHACCKTDLDQQGGVYLFPGEESYYEGADWAKLVKGELLGAPATLLYCDGVCPRDNRPLGCRIFPLTPDFARGAYPRVRFDYRARPMCPLVRSGMRGLAPAFVEGVREAMRVIAEDPDGYVFLENWAALEKEYDFHL